jgi:CBS domain-containing protein
MGVLEAGSRQLVVAYEDELIAEAVERMLSNDVGRLPVVSREDPARLVGYLGRAGVVAARQRLIDDESIRERGSVAVTS